MVTSTTPQKGNDTFRLIVQNLNSSFGVDIPKNYRSPEKSEGRNLQLEGLKVIRQLFCRDQDRLNGVIIDFEEWVAGRTSPIAVAFATTVRSGSVRGTRGRQRSEEPQSLSDDEKDARMRYLIDLINDQFYLLNGGVRQSPQVTEEKRDMSPKRRKLSEDDEFHTAPTSPTKVDDENDMPPPKLDLDRVNVSLRPNGQSDPNKGMSFLEKLKLGQQNQARSFYSNHDTVATSFSTVGNSVFSSHVGRSFDTEITDVTGTQSTYADSVVESFLLEAGNSHVDPSPSAQDMIVNTLRQLGPFSWEQTFPETIPLRYCYELERVARAWDVPFAKIFQRHVSFKSPAELWSFFAQHSERQGKPMPEKASPRAWDAAIGDFKTDRNSEVVVMTGELDWIPFKEGIFKLKLNPLKAERTCRFHRRFGSDRFLSLTIPAPARPPRDIGSPSQPNLLHESMAEWLTRTDHQCLGRTWRAFFVEEIKSKSKKKVEPRLRVEFFAVDGIDFRSTSSMSVAPPEESSDAHTSMSVQDLLEWHMPTAYNGDQKNCKLFQRIALGLSKTFASVTLKPTQVLHLRDIPSWVPVMNDGCALMSRALAIRICKILGIAGYTPSAFQGRIAGAKGLWMVDQPQSKHQSFSEDDGDDLWIEISDSQLKIHPHPQDWGEYDEEKLTFEVVNWSKSLHPVGLNTQILTILDYGAHVKDYIADLTRKGFEDLAKGLEEVLDSDSPVLCRAFVQKMKPTGEGAKSSRQLDQWIVDDAEHIIRLVEAGFRPQSFFPLRKALHRLFRHTLESQVERLHIEVPLSTYAYCIADPLGVLEPEEVHFAFSTNWRDADGNFQRTHLMDMDVLVGRLPAHVPSDIQRRRAVYKHELAHFQDIIVFSSKGNVPLAQMLSGGDYDGDTPWICWDPMIVESFQNSDMPNMELHVEHFGLTEHNKPMADMDSTEDFLQGAFEFNLHISLLGRCTIEHEKIAYDESIDSPKAKELACLLSHLVDGRKGGVLLSEEAWKTYRNSISPRPRSWPAYRENSRRPKRTNIVDYLKFYVAENLCKKILTYMEAKYPMGQGFERTDQDLARPWHEAQIRAENERNGDLQKVLKEISSSIEAKKIAWVDMKTENDKYAFRAQQAVDLISTLKPPQSSHPLVHTWQNSPREWRRQLASCTYERYRDKNVFPWFAFGDTLCELKAETLPSRSMTNTIYSCYKLNQKMVANLTASELAACTVESGFGGDEYEGEDAIEALLMGDDVGYFDGLEDGSSIQ
ncbi:hypothetical protein N7490_007017 [Penicillium lividum]|nr:hypothetical protein N7490_007017 [Penicillium lividum]